jgi:hypothetical protein
VRRIKCGCTGFKEREAQSSRHAGALWRCVEADVRPVWYEGGPSGFCECGCGERTQIIKHTCVAKGYFRGQHYRFKQGHSDNKLSRPEGKLVVAGDTRRILIPMFPLSDGRTTIVDESDYHLVSDYRWNTLKQFIKNRGWVYYARSSKFIPDPDRATGYRQVLVLLHRIVMDAPDYLTVDHIDGDGLNNTRSNLRLATDSQNGGNMRVVKSSSGFKGVSWNGTSWVASFVGGHIGSYKDKIAAARAYDKAAIKYFGEFAATNESLGLFREEYIRQHSV